MDLRLERIVSLIYTCKGMAYLSYLYNNAFAFVDVITGTV